MDIHYQIDPSGLIRAIYTTDTGAISVGIGRDAIEAASNALKLAADGLCWVPR